MLNIRTQLLDKNENLLKEPNLVFFLEDSGWINAYAKFGARLLILISVNNPKEMENVTILSIGKIKRTKRNQLVLSWAKLSPSWNCG